MTSWRELKRFCERDGWELYKDTDHYFYSDNPANNAVATKLLRACKAIEG